MTISRTKNKIYSVICPRCKGTWIQRRGFSNLKQERIQVYYCRKCGHSFQEKKKRITPTAELKEKIITLYHSAKAFPRKFDPMKKYTYSTREISRMVGASSSFVWNTIRRHERQHE